MWEKESANAVFDAIIVTNREVGQRLVEFPTKRSEVAKNQLNKFYNPTLYKPPPQQELTEEERIYVANGGVLLRVLKHTLFLRFSGLSEARSRLYGQLREKTHFAAFLKIYTSM